MRENNYPQLCFDTGLTCESCTEETARQIARVCKGLRGKAIGQLFVSIHTDPACARMHSHFAESYRLASILLDDEPVRKPAATVRTAAMAAVA